MRKYHTRFIKYRIVCIRFSSDVHSWPSETSTSSVVMSISAFKRWAQQEQRVQPNDATIIDWIESWHKQCPSLWWKKPAANVVCEYVTRHEHVTWHMTWACESRKFVHTQQCNMTWRATVFFSTFDASHYTFVINIVRSVGCATMMLSRKKGAAHFSASATTSPGAIPQRARGPPSRLLRRLGACPAGLSEKIAAGNNLLA